jgi:hypothetical protein
MPKEHRFNLAKHHAIERVLAPNRRAGTTNAARSQGEIPKLQPLNRSCTDNLR